MANYGGFGLGSAPMSSSMPSDAREVVSGRRLLALKGNQETLHDDVRYLEAPPNWAPFASGGRQGRAGRDAHASLPRRRLVGAEELAAWRRSEGTRHVDEARRGHGVEQARTLVPRTSSPNSTATACRSPRHRRHGDAVFSTSSTTSDARRTSSRVISAMPWRTPCSSSTPTRVTGPGRSSPSTDSISSCSPGRPKADYRRTPRFKAGSGPMRSGKGAECHPVGQVLLRHSALELHAVSSVSGHVVPPGPAS